MPLGKKHLGKSAAGGIIHITQNDLGPSSSRDLLDNISRLTSQWLMMDGFSVGASDLDVSKGVLDENTKTQDEYLEKARKLMVGLHSGKYDKVR